MRSRDSWRSRQCAPETKRKSENRCRGSRHSPVDGQILPLDRVPMACWLAGGWVVAPFIGCLAAVEPADRHIVGGRCIVFACRFPICSFHLFKVDRFMSLASVREFLAQRAPDIDRKSVV